MKETKKLWYQVFEKWSNWEKIGSPLKPEINLVKDSVGTFNRSYTIPLAPMGVLAYLLCTLVPPSTLAKIFGRM
jgi:hypothetical protein